MDTGSASVAALAAVIVASRLAGKLRDKLNVGQNVPGLLGRHRNDTGVVELDCHATLLVAGSTQDGICSRVVTV